MFIINDIELLERLNKHKILPQLSANCAIAISSYKLNEYSFQIKRVISSINELSILHVEKEGFDVWMQERRKYLTIGDLSSIYLALSSPRATLVLSTEDDFLQSEAEKCDTACQGFDSFFIKMIKDERVIQLYNLIKAA